MKNALSFIGGFLTNAFVTVTALAQPTTPQPPSLNPLGPGDRSLTEILLSVIQWFLFVAGFLAVLYLIYGGILYVTAGGDTEKATKGRTTIINAVIGIVIILVAFVIVRTVINATISGTVR